MANGKVLNVACPKCKESFNYYESSFRPFCSERCKEVDLGLWFTETYKVASKEQLN
ncbi:MAG: DNA gyrase inhibitor YacG [Halobacteriovoraceae bacterium]|nr:DNA gyrase inhibitor YacG [Halobacteriovoraceae bacterium]